MGHTRREHEQGTGLQLMAALAGSCELPPVAGGLAVTTERLRGAGVGVE